MLSEHSLVVHLHLLLPKTADDSAAQGLARTWKACRTKLGMDRPAVATALPDELPITPADFPASGGVAACHGRNGEAILQRHHDLLFLSVALTGTGDPTERWSSLERRWADAIGEIDWAVGETRLLVAYGNVEPTLAEAPAEVLALLTTAAQGRRPQLLPPATQVARPQALLWVMPGTDTCPLRRIVAVTHQEKRAVRDLEFWLWSETTNRPARFARYLSHAAKARHQLRLLSAAAPSPDLGPSIDQALTALEPPPAGLANDTSAQRLTDLEASHGHLLTELNGKSGVVRRIFELKEMRRTVEIAAANMRLESPPVHASGNDQDGLFAEDQEVARWSTRRLDDAIAYLELDRDHARDVVQMLRASIDTMLQRRLEALEKREAASRRRQESTTLLQTALIGAVLMILTAIQAFGYKIRALPHSTVPAIIATLGALALFLATPWCCPRLAQAGVYSYGYACCSPASSARRAAGWRSRCSSG